MMVWKPLGRSNEVSRTVSLCLIPRCRASQVTSSSGPNNPFVTPAIARSPVLSAEVWWASMLRARSKTRSRGASIIVDKSMTDISVLLKCFEAAHRSMAERYPHRENECAAVGWRQMRKFGVADQRMHTDSCEESDAPGQ